MKARNTLESLKSAFLQKTTGGGDQTWKLFYPFWKMPDDSVAVVRFLPDLDEDNSLGFLVENLTHELTINGERKRVPCLAMYGESCPICELSRRHYNEGNEVLGKRYYKKKGYIGQVIVIDSPIEHDQNQLVKLIEFGPKIFKQIQAAFQSGDLEEVPYALKGGYNFRIKKTKSGQYADYGTSSFAPKQSDLEDEIINQLKLFDLKEYRAKYMDRATLESMLIADQTGEAFSADAEEEPTTVPPVAVGPAANIAPAAAKPVTPPKVEAPTPAPTPAPASSKAQSILEQLRARAKAVQGGATN